MDHNKNLQRFLPQIDVSDMYELCLNNEDDKEVGHLFRILGDSASVTKALQSLDDSLAGARVLFDVVLKKSVAARLRLGDRSNLDENVAFENTVCKVQNGKENTLTAGERKLLQQLFNLRRCADVNRTQ